MDIELQRLMKNLQFLSIVNVSSIPEMFFCVKIRSFDKTKIERTLAKKIIRITIKQNSCR